MKRVIGIGGIFFKSENPQELYDWYEKHLGIQRQPHGQGASFHWREPQAADGTEPGPKGLYWVVRPPADYEIFRCEQSELHGLDELLEDLKKSGIEIDPHRENHDYGRFAWDHRPRRQPH
jgi:D-3-phosphoglycerate dehydrogenase